MARPATVEAKREALAPDAVDGRLVDARFRTLVGDAAWSQLPVEVQRRFAKRLAPGEMALYRGEVVFTRLSWLGWVLALAARLIGAPLPTQNGAVGAAVVMVTEDAALGGQRWVRIYDRPGRRGPQLIQSAKRFRGATGLEEHVGGGVAMTLTVRVEDGALVFRSGGYFVEWGRLRVDVPSLLSPGAMTIAHRPRADQAFAFELTLDHPRLGRLLHQLAVFRDA